MTCLILPKLWSTLCRKISPATLTQNGISVYLNLPSSVLKAVRKVEVSLSSWYQYPFLQSHTVHDACICKQMRYVIWCLEIIGFPHYCFIKIGGVPTDPKFQVAKFVLPLHKHKAVNPWSDFMYWLQNSHFEKFLLSALGLVCKVFGLL